jgi:hypothetical protein
MGKDEIGVLVFVTEKITLLATLRLLPLFGDFTSSRDVKERLMVTFVRCRTDARKYCKYLLGERENRATI